MTPEEFAVGIKQMFVDDAIQTYRDLYSQVVDSDNTDQYSKDIQAVFSCLDESGKEAFFNILRIICIDSTNSFLSLLDGSSGLDGQKSELKLVSMDNPEEALSGDLMAYFYDALHKTNS